MLAPLDVHMASIMSQFNSIDQTPNLIVDDYKVFIIIFQAIYFKEARVERRYPFGWVVI